VIEAEITRKLEEAVNTISGIKEISSRSYEGLSLVIIRFDLNIDPVQAAQEVREKIALVKPAFRAGVEEPLITRFDPDENPVVSLALKSEKIPARELTTLADQLIKRRLQMFGRRPRYRGWRCATRNRDRTRPHSYGSLADFG
jgi:HAE1 family hydrophobic/amphiphilic exporter-1